MAMKAGENECLCAAWREGEKSKGGSAAATDGEGWSEKLQEDERKFGSEEEKDLWEIVGIRANVCVRACEQALSVTREVILLKGRGEEKVEFLKETLPKRRRRTGLKRTFYRQSFVPSSSTSSLSCHILWMP